MRARAWLSYLLGGGILTLLYFAVPRGGLAQNLLYLGIGAAGVATIAVGVLRHRPNPSRAWWLLAGGTALWVLADALITVYELVLHRPAPFPSAADVLYLAGYPLIGAAVWLLGPALPRARRAELLDVAIVWLALGTLVWVWVGGDPALNGAGLGSMMALAYPLMDVLLIGALARMILVRGVRSPSQLLLLGAMAASLFADVVFAVTTRNGVYLSGDPIDAGWLLAYILVGAAALHPSMSSLTGRGTAPAVRMGHAGAGHIGTLGAATLAPIALLGLSAVGVIHLGPANTVVTITVTLAAVALLVVRMAGFVRTAERSSEALVSSEARHRSILDNSLAGIFSAGPDFRITYANPELARLFDYHSPEALVRDFATAPERMYAETEGGADVLLRALRGERSPVEVRFRRRDGSAFWGQSVVRVVRDDEGDGHIVQLIGMVVDVSARRDAEEAAATSEERYRDIFENAAEAIYRTDTDGRVVVANPALARMFGYASPQELLEAGARFDEHTDDETIREDVRRAAERAPVRGTEMPMRDRAGKRFWWSANVRTIRDASGGVAGYEGTASDITERWNAQARARRQHEHLQLLQAAAVAANQAASPEVAIQTVIDKICTQLGWPLGHAFLRTEPEGPLQAAGIWHDAEPGTHAAFRAVTIEAEIVPGTGLSGRVLSAGSPGWITAATEEGLGPRAPAARDAGLRSGFAFPVKVGGEVVAILEFFTPEQLEPDQELMRLLTHIGTQLARVVERTRDEAVLRDAYEREKEAGRVLKALDDMKNSILTAVSHELRTPLTAVYGFAELLEKQASRLSPEQFQLVAGRLAENARRLDRLLGDLLDLDRLTRGIIEPRLERMDLSLLAHRVVRESGAFETGRVNLQAEPVTMDLDRAKVERIVENLVSNALRYSPPGSPIDVTVGPTSGGASIVVEDRGPGVPEDIRTEIFEPFRQGPNASRSSPGVGIGLSLVARFTTLHGGRAWVESREGGGARFVVFLPDRREQGPARVNLPESVDA